MSFFAHTAAKRAWQVLLGNSRRPLPVSDLLWKYTNNEVKEPFESNGNGKVTNPHRALAKSSEQELGWAELRPTIANVPQAFEDFPTLLRSWAELRPGANYTPPTIVDD